MCIRKGAKPPPAPTLASPAWYGLADFRGWAALWGPSSRLKEAFPLPPLILSPKVNLSDNGGSHLCTYNVGPLKTSLNCLIWLTTKNI
jgi:hypothetical protein